MKIETASHACAVLAVLIAGADGRGTLAESRYLYTKIADTPPFADLSPDDFARLLAVAADWVWTGLPREEGRPTDEAVEEVLGRICEVIAPDHRERTLEMAVGLAAVDGVSPEERSLILRLCDGLGLDASAADDLMEDA